MVKYLFFDFEVLPKYWCCIIIINDIVFEFETGRELKVFFYKHKDAIWVGYNNKFYDNLILEAIIAGYNPFEISKMLIHDKIHPQQIRKNLDLNIQFNYLDLMQTKISLKKILAFAGKPIETMNLPWNYQHELTPAEKMKLQKYCYNDVLWLKYLLNKQKKHILDLKSKIIKQFKLSVIENLNKTIPSLVANALVEKRQYFKYDEFYKWPENLHIKNKEIKNFYSQKINPNKFLYIKMNNAVLKFGYGGLHLNKKIARFNPNKKYMYIDVQSYYPWIMRNFNLLSKSISEQKKLEYYKMLDFRMNYKKQNLSDADKAKDVMYKVILNSTFGAMKHKYNKLYDLENFYAVTITGQLLLWNLFERFKDDITLQYVNTDGFIVKYKRPYIDVVKIIDNWCNEFNFSVKIAGLKWFSIKNTNWYIIQFKNGKVDFGGALVNKADYFHQDKENIEYNETIVHNGILAYFIDKIPPEQFVNNCNNPLYYQIIRSIGNTFDNAVWNVDSKYYKINLGVNRVFASKNIKHGKIYKIKKGSLNKIENLPEHVFVHNQNIESVNIDLVDKKYYIDKIKKGIHEFEDWVD